MGLSQESRRTLRFGNVISSWCYTLPYILNTPRQTTTFTWERKSDCVAGLHPPCAPCRTSSAGAGPPASSVPSPAPGERVARGTLSPADSDSHGFPLNLAAFCGSLRRPYMVRSRDMAGKRASKWNMRGIMRNWYISLDLRFSVLLVGLTIKLFLAYFLIFSAHFSTFIFQVLFTLGNKNAIQKCYSMQVHTTT